MAGKLEIVAGGDSLVALITCPSEESATALAERLVADRVVACVNMVPGITSVYRWQGEVCRDRECLLVAKTTAARREGVAAAITALHPYDEPELLFLPIDSGSKTYLHWLVEQASGPKAE